MARSAPRSGLQVDSARRIGVAGHVEHLVVRPAGVVDPSLDYLKPQQRRAPPIALRRHDESGSGAGSLRRQVAAHGHAARIAGFHGRRAGVIGKIPAAEETRADAGSRGSEHLTPLQRIEQGVARVFHRPHSGQAARVGVQPDGVDRAGGQALGEIRFGHVVAGPVTLVNLTRGRQVRVGRADHTELVRVCSKVAPDLQAVQQDAAVIVIGGYASGVQAGPNPGLAFPAKRRRIVFRRLPAIVAAHFLHVAQLVGTAQNAGQSVEALGAALVLKDLHDRLKRIALPRQLSGALPGHGSAVAGWNQRAGTQVRAVRYGQDLATRNAVQALAGQTVPEFVVGRRLETGDRQCRHLVVAEDDVAVVGVAVRRATVLVGHEGREAAVRGPVVCRFGHLAGALPIGPRGFQAAAAVLAADVGAARRHVSRQAPHEEENRRRPALAKRIAASAGVGLAVGVRTQREFAEELRVIGYRREVERRADPADSLRLAAFRVRRKRDFPASRKSVGIGRQRRHAQGPRIVGVGSVYVQITEIGVAIGVSIRAGLPLFRVTHEPPGRNGGRLLRRVNIPTRVAGSCRGAAARQRGPDDRARNLCEYGFPDLHISLPPRSHGPAEPKEQQPSRARSQAWKRTAPRPNPEAASPHLRSRTRMPRIRAR